MNDHHEIVTALRQFVRENFLYMRPDSEFGDDQPLLATGVIDSLGVMELVVFIEEHWHVEVRPGDVTTANFGCITSMAGYVSEAAQRGAAIHR